MCVCQKLQGFPARARVCVCVWQGLPKCVCVFSGVGRAIKKGFPRSLVSLLKATRGYICQCRWVGWGGVSQFRFTLFVIIFSNSSEKWRSSWNFPAQESKCWSVLLLYTKKTRVYGPEMWGVSLVVKEDAQIFRTLAGNNSKCRLLYCFLTFYLLQVGT